MAEVTWEEFAAHIEHFAYAEAYRLGGTSDVAQLELVRWATLRCCCQSRGSIWGVLLNASKR